MKKKHWLIPVFAVLCISIGIGIIMAYLSDDEVKTNEIEIAENKVSIQETFPDEKKIQKQGGTEYQKKRKNQKYWKYLLLHSCVYGVS